MGAHVLLLALLGAPKGVPIVSRARTAAQLEEGSALLQHCVLTPNVREVMLSTVDSSLARSKARRSPRYDWYSPAAERLLSKLLRKIASAADADPASSRRNSGKWGMAETESLWLLCRTQLGAIEAVLLELGDAASRIRALRGRWHAGVGKTASARLGGVVYRRVLARGRKGSYPLLGGPKRSRLGTGARRRALLRSERILAAHAGALHDLRVALLKVGGEWIALGRWLGGPPLPTMDWDVQLTDEKRRRMLALCGQVNATMGALANELGCYGPYEVYRAGATADEAPCGGRRARGRRPAARADEVAPTRDAMLAAVADQLGTLRATRAALRVRGPPPHSLTPPSRLREYWIWWLCLASALGRLFWLLHTRDESAHALYTTALALLAKVWTDGRRFYDTHVAEPFAGIAKELFAGGFHPAIDTEQLDATRASLSRALGDFVNDVHRNSPADVRAAALAAAAKGSMEPVIDVYEQQMRTPVSGMFRGELGRAMLLQFSHLELLMQEQIATVDAVLRRNDFSLQLMATVPAFIIGACLFLLVRWAWIKLRSSSRGPIDDLRSELTLIEGALTRAAGSPPPGADKLTQHEASPMELTEAGYLVFRVQRLRQKGSQWLRGWLRQDLLHDAEILLDSGRLCAAQRAQIANSLLRRLDKVHALVHHW